MTFKRIGLILFKLVILGSLVVCAYSVWQHWFYKEQRHYSSMTVTKDNPLVKQNCNCSEGKAEIIQKKGH